MPESTAEKSTDASGKRTVLEVDADTDRFNEVLRENLPQYMINCLVAAGFDSEELISSLRVRPLRGTTSDDDLAAIEDYVEEALRNDKEYTGPTPIRDGVPFRFLIGHRRKLALFVMHLQQKNAASLRKKRRGFSSGISSHGVTTDPDTMLARLSDALGIWCVKQKEDRLRYLVEGRDYQVQIKTQKGRSEARCLCNHCNKSFLLSTSGDRSVPIISNFTKHIKGCSEYILNWQNENFGKTGGKDGEAPTPAVPKYGPQGTDKEPGEKEPGTPAKSTPAKPTQGSTATPTRKGVSSLPP
eukprot:Clim_evm39s235 gene=Clim_evmTU39s235